MSTAGELSIDPGDPEIRRAKTVLFVLVMTVLAIAILVMLVFFQPDTQVVVTRWPNGYPKTETRYVLDELGQRVKHGLYREWHENGQLAGRGRFEQGRRVGTWERWRPDGTFEPARSGVVSEGEARPLPGEEAQD